MIKYYALYKGEKLLCSGTKVQIANKMGVKLRTIKFYKTPTNLKRNKNNRRLLIEIEDYDE